MAASFEMQGQSLVGDPQTAQVAFSDAKQDEECVCGTGMPMLQGGTATCCFCCRVNWSRLPEVILLSVVVVAAVFQYIFGKVTKMWFAFSIITRSRSGIFFSLLAFVFLPATLALGLRGPTGAFSRANMCRFRCVSLALTAACLILNLTSILVVWPEAQRLEGAVSSAFGISEPPNPTQSALSITSWMFSSSPFGPYLPIYEEFGVETHTFLSGLQPRPGWTENCPSRAFLQSLAMDVVMPARENGQLVPIIFFVHGGGFIGGDKDGGLDFYSYFVKRGYALVSSQYGFVCDGFSAFDMVDQLTIAFDYMRANATKWGMDPNRIFVVGQSAGGHLGCLLTYTLNSPSCGGWRSCGIRGVYNQYGVVAIVEKPASGSRDRLLIDAFHGTSNWEDALLAYPLAYVNSSSAPTLTHHGTWDSIVPYYMATELHQALRTAGVKEYLMTLPTFEHVCEYGYWQGCAQLFRFALERFLASTEL